MTEKLYVVVREDLPAGDQIAQAVHTALAFAFEHPEVARAWHEASNNLAVLAVPNERELAILMRKAGNAAVLWSGNSEPDLGDSITGVALAPEGKKLTRAYPLALRPRPPEAGQGLANAAPDEPRVTAA